MNIKSPELSNGIFRQINTDEILQRPVLRKSSDCHDKNKSPLESMEQELKSITDDLNENMLVFDRRLQFQTFEDTDMLYIKVVDAESGKVIREIPPEEVLKLSKNLKEMIGIIFDEKR